MHDKTKTASASIAPRKSSLTTYIVIALVLGIAVGYGCNQLIQDEAQLAEVAGYISLAADVFL